MAYCRKNEALNDTGMPDRQANEHMCTLWFQGCGQDREKMEQNNPLSYLGLYAQQFFHGVFFCIY